MNGTYNHHSINGFFLNNQAITKTTLDLKQGPIVIIRRKFVSQLISFRLCEAIVSSDLIGPKLGIVGAGPCDGDH